MRTANAAQSPAPAEAPRYDADDVIDYLYGGLRTPRRDPDRPRPRPAD